MLEITILIIFLMRKFGVDFSGASYDWLNSTLIAREEKLGRLLWVTMLSAVLILAAMFYARADTQCDFLGGHYVKLAKNPFLFDENNPVTYRLLTPFLSWLIGFRGRGGLLILNLIISGALVGAVYSYYRKTAQQAGDAFLAATITTFSLVVLTSIHCGGYTDITSYLLIFLMWHYRTKRLLFHLLFLLGLLNRESVAFLIPWLAFISWEADVKWWRKTAELMLGFAVTLGVYYLFRLWVDSHQTVTYSVSYYLDELIKNPLGMFRKTLYWQPLGLFSVFKFMWIIPFLAILSWLKLRNYRQLFGITLLGLGVYSQLLIAYDTSRMLTLGFMVMFVSLDHLLEENRFHIRNWIYWVVLFNFIFPQPYTASDKIEVWQTLSSWGIQMLWK